MRFFPDLPFGLKFAAINCILEIFFLSITWPDFVQEGFPLCDGHTHATNTRVLAQDTKSVVLSVFLACRTGMVYEMSIQQYFVWRLLTFTSRGQFVPDPWIKPCIGS